MSSPLQPTIRKDILLIEPPAGAISRVAPALKDLGFSVLRVGSTEVAMNALSLNPQICLVSVDEGVGAEAAARLVESAKDLYPDLPVFWVKRRTLAANVFRHVLPDVMLSYPVDPEVFRRQAESVLCVGMYPHVIVEQITSSAKAALLESFNTKLTPAQPFLRSNRNVLSHINALVPFVGVKVSGRLLVGSSPECLTAIRRRVLPNDPEPTSGQLEDLAGELANQVLGRLKGVFHSYSYPFELGTPMFIQGVQSQLRYKAGRPSMVIPFKDATGTVYVEFCFDIFDPDGLSPPSAEPLAPSGELEFL